MFINKYVLIYLSMIMNIDGDKILYIIGDLKYNIEYSILLRVIFKVEWGFLVSLNVKI